MDRRTRRGHIHIDHGTADRNEATRVAIGLAGKAIVRGAERVCSAQVHKTFFSAISMGRAAYGRRLGAGIRGAQQRVGRNAALKDAMAFGREDAANLLRRTHWVRRSPPLFTPQLTPCAALLQPECSPMPMLIPRRLADGDRARFSEPYAASFQWFYCTLRTRRGSHLAQALGW